MENKFYDYDVIVVGGGLSGCEAAAASARRGMRTLLISINMDSVAALQFGNIIWMERFKDLFRALDTMGSRTLRIIRKNILGTIKNKKKPFKYLKDNIVLDRKRFALNMKEMLENHENLETRQGLAADISKRKNDYIVITSDRQRYRAVSVIVCTGTYMDATIRWGENFLEAGRPGEIRSSRLYKNLRQKGVKFEKRRIFCAPKIIINSITNDQDISKLIKDSNSGIYAVPSFRTSNNSDSCTIYLIPEGKETEEMYVWGFENSLSEEEQIKRFEEVSGLENIYMTRPGYGIEYSCLHPSMQSEDLQVKGFKGLFFAGRVCGSTTYEESLAMGALAGINAGNIVKGKETVNRSEIEDLLGNNRN